MVKTHSSSGIRSSMSTSPATSEISVRRSSLKESRRFRASVLTISSTMAWLERISSHFLMKSSFSCSSSMIFCISRPARRPSCICTMAVVWMSSRPNRCERASFDSGIVALLRMMAMTSSMKSSATFKPSRMWARSAALRRSNMVRRRMISHWKSMARWSISFNVRICGLPSARAIKIAPKVVCRSV